MSSIDDPEVIVDAGVGLLRPANVDVGDVLEDFALIE